METFRVCLIGSVLSCALAAIAVAGPLTPPPGPVAPTMKTLQQVEPRVPLEFVPGDSEAMHVITQPGSYYMTSCVTLAPGKTTFIRVGASNVTIDMMGFEADGQNVPDAVGIRPVPFKGTYSGLVVMNGSFTHWYQGINATDGSYIVGGRYERLTFNQTGLTGLLAGDFSLITDCTGENCGADCFVMYNGGSFSNCVARGAGTGFNCGHGATLSNCQAQDCGTGFYSFFDNVFTGCGAVYCGTGWYGNGGHTLMNCSAQKCIYGFALADRNALTGCNASATGIDAVELGAQNTVTNGNFSQNYSTGIRLFGSGNLVHGCTASYNGGPGLLADALSSDNTIRDNHVSECYAGTGIEVQGVRSRIEGNHVSGCAGTGIVVYGAANLVIRNSACGNGIGPSDQYFIDSSNAAGPVLNPADLAGSSNPHANYHCGIVPVGTARAGREVVKKVPVGPRFGPGVGMDPPHYKPVSR